MSERRRGLGRGLGALIPAGPNDQDRPRDVFFPRDGAGSAERGTGPGSADGFTGNIATQNGDAMQTVASSEAATTTGGPHDQGGSATVGEVAAGAETTTGPELAPVPGATYAEIPIDQVRPNPRQPREVFDEDELAELVHSISELGVLQPVVVRRLDHVCTGQDADESDSSREIRYELVMGERRLRASRAAGRATIPAIVRETDDDNMLRDALLENLHRAQLNPLEEAAAYQQLLEDFSCTHDELASRIGRSRPQISNTIRLLRLPPMVQRRVASGVLSAGHARALLGLEDGAAMERLAQRIVAEGLSVRSVEEIVVVGDGEQIPRRSSRRTAPSPELKDVADRLSDRFETRVQVAMGQRKGRITVEFAGAEDLERILSLLESS